MGEQKEKVNRSQWFLPDKFSLTLQCFGFDSPGWWAYWTIEAKSALQLALSGSCNAQARPLSAARRANRRG